MIPIEQLSTAFTSNGFIHRERSLSVEDVRRHKAKVFVLTNSASFADHSLIAKADGVLNSLDALTDEEIAEAAFYVLFAFDEDSVSSILRIIRCGGLFIPPMNFSKGMYSRSFKHSMSSIVESANKVGQLFGDYELHENICQAIDMTRQVEGDFLELGVFTGSSAATALTHMRNRGLRRRCWLMDTFGGFNYTESFNSADAIWAGTHQGMPVDVQLRRLGAVLASTGQDVIFIPGNICSDELPKEITALSVVNIDVDLYEATRAALEKVSPMVSPRGVIICEDPTGTPGLYGAFAAMEEFLQTPTGKKFIKVFLKTQYFLIRID